MKTTAPSPTMTDLLCALDTLETPKVLVLGDLILDRYTWGNVERISQEAPVPVIRVDKQEPRPGGAANVCQMVAGLGGSATCLGVVGDDHSGNELKELLESSDIETAGIVTDPTRPTTTKERFIGRAAGRHPNQLLRVDRETSSPITEATATRLLDYIQKELAQHQVCIISDYDKGVCTDWLITQVIELANETRCPILIDPKRGGDYQIYNGATLIKPNRIETAEFLKQELTDISQAPIAAHKFLARVKTDHLLITLDKEGMLLANKEESSPLHFPIEPQEVYDITGAGDIVMAMIGLGFATGLPLAQTIFLGNLAAGLEVQRPGVAIVTRKEIRQEIFNSQTLSQKKHLKLREAAILAENYRNLGKKIVFTNGCFDLLHVGHVNYLTEAAALGEILVVGVNSDQSVRNLKGPERPIINEQDRCAMLTSLSC
ncbi:MAG: PfkB family carbohydrate kinase, partial [Pirellulaceae bacterium]|nr:PfkB family carbohydrate kinase [Pirellulaceae bacterium]